MQKSLSLGALALAFAALGVALPHQMAVAQTSNPPEPNGTLIPNTPDPSATGSATPLPQPT